MRERADQARQRLRDALGAIGQDRMAWRAGEGFYGDFTSPLATPKTELIHELGRLGTDAAIALARRVADGEFDG